MTQRSSSLLTRRRLVLLNEATAPNAANKRYRANTSPHLTLPHLLRLSQRVSQLCFLSNPSFSSALNLSSLVPAFCWYKSENFSIACSIHLYCRKGLYRHNPVRAVHRFRQVARHDHLTPLATSLSHITHTATLFSPGQPRVHDITHTHIHTYHLFCPLTLHGTTIVL